MGGKREIFFPFAWRRESAVAGDEVVGENRDQPFPGRIDDPAADDAAGVAAKTHTHG